MRRIRITVLSVLSVALLVSGIVCPRIVNIKKLDLVQPLGAEQTANATEIGAETVVIEEKAEQEINTKAEYDDEQLAQKLVSMLNINYCYNSSFEDNNALAGCAAVVLHNYSIDFDGYGLCVNTLLAEGFVISFYGINADFSALDSIDAPVGYYAAPNMGLFTQEHTLISMQKTVEGYEVLTCLEMYFGGDDFETCLVKAHFVENAASEFGFNLIFAETL